MLKDSIESKSIPICDLVVILKGKYHFVQSFTDLEKIILILLFFFIGNPSKESLN